jgi:hypothetical protein
MAVDGVLEDRVGTRSRLIESPMGEFGFVRPGVRLKIRRDRCRSESSREDLKFI